MEQVAAKELNNYVECLEMEGKIYIAYGCGRSGCTVRGRLAVLPVTMCGRLCQDNKSRGNALYYIFFSNTSRLEISEMGPEISNGTRVKYKQ